MLIHQNIAGSNAKASQLIKAAIFQRGVDLRKITGRSDIKNERSSFESCRRLAEQGSLIGERSSACGDLQSSRATPVIISLERETRSFGEQDVAVVRSDADVTCVGKLYDIVEGSRTPCHAQSRADGDIPTLGADIEFAARKCDFGANGDGATEEGEFGAEFAGHIARCLGGIDIEAAIGFDEVIGEPE